MQVVVFTIGEEKFAVETNKVQGINSLIKITRVPKADSYIKGLLNLRGNVLTVLDINRLLGIEASDENKNNIIVLKMDAEEVAITVDSVEEVMNIDDDIIMKVHEEDEKPFVKGIINMEDKIITMIDINKLLR